MGVKWIALVAAVGLMPGLAAGQESKPPVRPPDAAPTSQDAPLPPPGPLASPRTRAGQPEQVPMPSGEKPPAGGMTLAELEELAERCNPTLVQAMARVQAARGLYLQVGLYPNPLIGYQGTEIGQEGRAGQQGGFLARRSSRLESCD